MAEYLVLRLDAADPANAEWLIADGDGRRCSQVFRGPLTSAGRESGGRPVIVLVPSADVLLCTATIPARSPSRLRAMLPYALEEQLADDVDELHFAAGTRLDSGAVPVAVVGRAILERWLSALDAAGIRPQRLIAEQQAVAPVPNTVSLIVDGDLLMVSDGDQLQFALQDVGPNDALLAAGLPAEVDDADAAPASRHLLVHTDAAGEQRFAADWAELRERFDSVDMRLLEDSALPRLAVAAAAGHGINLLQGDYGPRTEYAALLRPWRYAAALLLVFFVAAFAAKAADYRRLAAEQAELQQRFTAEYRRLRPGDSREVQDPIGVLRSLQRELGGDAPGTSFLPALRVIADALRPAADTRIEDVGYRARVVYLRIRAPNVGVLDTIQQGINESGRYAATIQATDRDGDQVVSRMQVREAAP